jgi:hypothetical protein
MNTLFLKLSVLAIAGTLIGVIGTGCSSNNSSSGTGGALGSGGRDAGAGGSGGAVSYDAGLDVPMGAEVSVPIDVSSSEAATRPEVGVDSTSPESSGDDICKGLAPGSTECHLRIINSTNPAVIPVDPGPNPAVGYPSCTSL